MWAREALRVASGAVSGGVALEARAAVSARVAAARVAVVAVVEAAG